MDAGSPLKLTSQSITIEPITVAQSPEPVQRLAAYRTLVMEPINPLELDAIRQHLQCQHA